MIVAAVTVPLEQAEELRAAFVELAAEGFQDAEDATTVTLTAYGPGAERIRDAFPTAVMGEVEDGWENRWREFHKGVATGRFWIGPPWEAAPAELLPIVIDPGQAFGTGSHPTTRLCLELLETIERGSLLDVGCGSGVLSIAAAKIGFGPASGFDFAQASVDAAIENAERNGVELHAWLGDALLDELPVADVAVANVTLPTVEAVLPRLTVDRVVTSGYLVSEQPVAPGYRHEARRELDGWAADLFVTATL